MRNNGFVLLAFLLICLVNLPAKKVDHPAASTATPVAAPAPAPLPAPLKMNQAGDVDLRPAVIHAAPSKLSDNN